MLPFRSSQWKRARICPKTVITRDRNVSERTAWAAVMKGTIPKHEAIAWRALGRTVLVLKEDILVIF